MRKLLLGVMLSIYSEQTAFTSGSPDHLKDRWSMSEILIVGGGSYIARIQFGGEA